MLTAPSPQAVAGSVRRKGLLLVASALVLLSVACDFAPPKPDLEPPLPPGTAKTSAQAAFLLRARSPAKSSAVASALEETQSPSSLSPADASGTSKAAPHP